MLQPGFGIFLSEEEPGLPEDVVLLERVDLRIGSSRTASPGGPGWGIMLARIHTEDGESMLSHRVAIIMIALGSVLLAACQPKALTPTELETIKASSDAYLAYERGDCQTVFKLTDPERLDLWAFNEMRHSMLLLQGFCRESEDDLEGARDIYRQLILESPNSFAADDAVERTRVLKVIEQDPDYADWIRTARERIDTEKPSRTPTERVPAEFPPLASATGIDGYAVVEFGITRSGETENPIVVESSPPLLFDGSALRAVRRWQYTSKRSTSPDDRQLIRILFRPDHPREAADQDPSSPQ